MERDEFIAAMEQESDEVSLAAYLCLERLWWARDLALNDVAKHSLLGLRELIDELLPNCVYVHRCSDLNAQSRTLTHK